MNDILKDELYHKWTDATKANYNREYYQKHKDWWKTKYADFTGGVKRAAANAKETVKGETPQSLWKSGARDIRKNLPELKKGISSNAKTLAERAKRKTSEAIDEAKWQADRLARKSGADSVAYKAAFSVGFVKGFVGGFAGEMKKDLAKSKKK